MNAMNEKPEPQWESRSERRARKRLERKQGSPPKKFSARIVWIVLVLIVGGGAWWLLPNMAKPAKPVDIAKKHQQLVDGCTTDAATTFHIHSHLSIIINDKETAIPTNIGVSGTCLHPLHTHDATGIVHIESPKKDDFTLTDFFGLWGKDYTAAKIIDQTVTADSQLKLFVNGKEVATGPATVMQDKTSYVIMFGPDKTELKPPTDYKFPDSL